MTDPEDTHAPNFTHVSNSQMQTTMSLSDALDIFNSTLTNWTLDENPESTLPSGEPGEDVVYYRIILWLYFTVRIIMGCLAILGNSLTILAVAKFERLQTCTNYLICNLAVNDLMAGLVVPLLIIHELFPNSSFFVPICLVEKILVFTITGGNFGSIMCLSIDRYIYIAHALRYHDLVTPKRIFLVLGFGWIFAVFSIPFLFSFANHLKVGMKCAFFLFLDKWVMDLFLFPQFLLFVFLTTGFHLAIARIAYKQARAIAAQQQPYETLDVAINQSTKKISRTLGMVLGVYLLSIMPQSLTVWAITENKSLLPLQYFTNILYWANSWLNPLIYAWRLRDFRIAFKKVLTGKGSFNEVQQINVAVIELN